MTFGRNDVEIKKMKEVGACAGSMGEFEKEVEMLDKFRCDEIVHFYGACFIPNIVMIVMEYAPCGSLGDCIVKRVEPSEQIKTKVMLDAARGWRTSTVTPFCIGASSGQLPCLLARRGA